jgi:group I intron endonuclease
MKPSAGIYEIRNRVNGHRYIGQSANVAERLSNHRSLLRHGKHFNPHLQRAWGKYGESAFEFEAMTLVYPPATKERLTELEQEAIDLFKPEYNICRECVTSRLGTTMSREIVERIASINRGTKRPQIGTARKRYFSEHPEAVDAMRKRASGKPMPPQTRAALLAANTGRPEGPEERGRKQKAMQQYLDAHPDEKKRVRAMALRNSMGMSRAAQGRAAASRRGKKQSEECIAKRVSASKKVWAEHPEILKRKNETLRGRWIMKALGLPEQGPEHA